MYFVALLAPAEVIQFLYPVHHNSLLSFALFVICVEIFLSICMLLHRGNIQPSKLNCITFPPYILSRDRFRLLVCVYCYRKYIVDKKCNEQTSHYVYYASISPDCVSIMYFNHCNGDGN